MYSQPGDSIQGHLHLHHHPEVWQRFERWAEANGTLTVSKHDSDGLKENQKKQAYC